MRRAEVVERAEPRECDHHGPTFGRTVGAVLHADVRGTSGFPPDVSGGSVAALGGVASAPAPTVANTEAGSVASFWTAVVGAPVVTCFLAFLCVVSPNTGQHPDPRPQPL